MTTAHKATTVGLADINQERADILRRELSSVLREDIVKDVLAQVIDGLPVAKTYIRVNDNTAFRASVAR